MLKLIIKNSLPMIISMMISSLYNIIDGYFVARISDSAMTSLSLVFPIQNLIIAVGVGFGIGVNATIAYHLGKKDINKATTGSTTGFYFSIIQGVILTIICLLLVKVFIRDYKDTDVYDYAIRYSYIVFSFTIVQSVSIYFEKLFQSVNHMKVTLLAMSSGCILNIILDPILINYFNVEGAAIATVIAQILTLIIYILCYYIIRLEIKIKSIKYCNISILKRVYNIGIPAMLNILLPSILILGLNEILTNIDKEGVLILGSYYKLQTFIYLSANGIVQGIRPLISYNYGGKNYNNVYSIIKISILISLIIMFIGTILSLLIPNILMDLFTDNINIINNGSNALRIISIGFIISSYSVIIMGVLEALGNGIESFVIAIIRYLLVLIISIILINKLNSLAVWISFPISEGIAFIVSILIYKFRIKSKLA